MAADMQGARSVSSLASRDGSRSLSKRAVPEEVPVAFSYGGSTHAVMMASPCDLEDFAFGFSLSEGIVTSPDEISGVEIVAHEAGYDVQIALAGDREEQLRKRRRHMAGPVGCGLCGIESIEQALRPVPAVVGQGVTLSPDDIARAVALLTQEQVLNHFTHAVHGAGFFIPGQGMVLVREDVGRHNALDKLCGAMLRGGLAGASGAVVVTSRISVEMVQKTAICGASVLIAISAPTALAIDTAGKAGITLIAIVRGDDFEVFTHENRVPLFPDRL